MVFPFEERRYKELVRAEARTNTAHGVDPWKRSIHELFDYGVLVLNKPPSLVSHQCVEYVKHILGVPKAGHSGTLDPNVTGVLVIALGKATRVVDVLLKAGKEYVCLMRIHTPVDEETIRRTFLGFLGKVEQLPPKKSAVKRQLRTREIYYLEILEIDDRDVLFRIGCQAGTYIRKVCTDVGKAMGTYAHMQELVRTKVGSFTDGQWATLHDLKDAYELWKEGDERLLRRILMPFERAVDHLPKVWIFDSAVDSICHGALLSVPGIVKLDSDIAPGDTVAILTPKGELVGIGKARMDAHEVIRQQKGVVVAETRIFMPRGTYPKVTRSI